MLDPNGYVSSWNEGAERLLGYRAEEILGKDQSIFYSPEAVAGRQPARDLRAAAAAADGRYELDERLVRHDQSPFLANVIMTALRNEDKTLRGFAVVMRDVTERKHHEQELAEQARLLNLSNDAIVFRDQDDQHPVLEPRSPGVSTDGRKVKPSEADLCCCRRSFPSSGAGPYGSTSRPPMDGELIHRTKAATNRRAHTLDWTRMRRGAASILEYSNDYRAKRGGALHSPHHRRRAEPFIRVRPDRRRTCGANREMYDCLVLSARSDRRDGG